MHHRAAAESGHDRHARIGKGRTRSPRLGGGDGWVRGCRPRWRPVARGPRADGPGGLVVRTARRVDRGSRARLCPACRGRSEPRCGEGRPGARLPGIPALGRPDRSQLARPGRAPARVRTRVSHPCCAARLPGARGPDVIALRGRDRALGSGDGRGSAPGFARRPLHGDDLQRDGPAGLGELEGGPGPDRRGGRRCLLRPAGPAHRERHLLPHDVRLSRHR